MATLARQKHNPTEREIAKTLGISDAQLAALLRIRAGYWPGNAATVLERKGLAYRETATRPHPCAGNPYWGALGEDRQTETYYTGKRGLTEAGEALLTMARSMGY